MSSELGSSSAVKMRRADGAKVPILTYHSIDDSGSVISTPPAVFQRQMKFLREAGYSSLTLRDLVSALRKGHRLPDKPVVLTFDDGFSNFLTAAFPVLSDYKLCATVFLVTDFCGKHNDWSGNPAELPRSELLSWDQIMELDSAGIEFGSHTRSHADLTKLDPAEVDNELVSSKSLIEDKLGRETHSFAYPFGRHNAEVRIAASTVFHSSCSTNLGKVSPLSDLSLLERIDTYYLLKQSMFERLQSSAFEKYLVVRQALRDVKTLVTT